MDYKEKVIALLNSQELSNEQKEKLESIFPELAESDDERIRKEIQSAIEQLDKDSTICGKKYDYNQWIAWLEKQGEQKPQRMTSAKAKESLLPDRELTEFEDLFIHIYQQKYPCELSDKDLEFCRKASNELLSIARKQFIEEACEYIHLHIGELNDLYIRTALREEFIKDFRKALEKGEQYALYEY